MLCHARTAQPSAEASPPAARPGVIGGSSRPAVLFVDDEEQSRKYFPKLIAGRWDVLCAESAGEARAMADAEGDRIGLIITDQRMPGESGSQLLAWMRVHHPLTVRVLTTAYSDLESAIAAVNEGEVFRYILKPWSLRELPAIVHESMQHHLLQRERQVLLRERMATLQHLVMLDRARTLAVLAAGMSHRLRHPLLAIKTFLEQAPPTRGDPLDGQSGATWEALRQNAQQASERALAMVERIIARSSDDAFSFSPGVRIADLLRPALDWGAHRLPGAIAADLPDDLPTIAADAAPLAALFTSLLSHMLRSGLTEGGVRVIARRGEVWGRPGLAVRFEGGSPFWDRARLAGLFGAISGHGLGSDPDLDLIAGYFVVFHHGGSLLVHGTPPLGPAIEVALPIDPHRELPMPLQRDWLGSIFAFPGPGPAAAAASAAAAAAAG
jgi:two-component system, probable response regulator PhcQ